MQRRGYDRSRACACDVVGCLWAGVTYAGVWAGPTDFVPEAIGVLRSAPPPPVQEATHERVRRVSTGCRPGAARACRQASALSRACRVVGGFLRGGGGGGGGGAGAQSTVDRAPPCWVWLPVGRLLPTGSNFASISP